MEDKERCKRASHHGYIVNKNRVKYMGISVSREYNFFFVVIRLNSIEQLHYGSKIANQGNRIYVLTDTFILWTLIAIRNKVSLCVSNLRFDLPLECNL